MNTITSNKNNQILIEQAILAFYQETNLKLNSITDQNGSKITIEGYADLTFIVYIKFWAQQANIGLLAEQVTRLSTNGLLVADYINPEMATKLRKLNIPFIDTAGNAYIHQQPIYVFIKGNKNHILNNLSQTKQKQVTGRAFQIAGIKVVYAIIHEPELLKASYRKISATTGVALGAISGIFDDLKNNGFLIETKGSKKNRYLKNKKDLFDKWVFAYTTKLRPKLFLGRFSSKNNNWWKKNRDDIAKYNAKWGGEVGALILTQYLQPEEITVYLPQEKVGHFLSDNYLFRSTEGKVCIYQSFQIEGAANSKSSNPIIADPMIIFADLVSSADPRNLEVARKIYNDEIIGLIGKN